MPILTGELRGTKWLIASSNRSCWIGTYELRTQELLKRLLRPGDIFYDLGAQAGFYALLSAKLVGTSGQVIAVEPLPRNVDFLRCHLQVNHVQNVTVLCAALSDRIGVHRFDTSPGWLGCHLSDVGDLQVQTYSLDELTFHEGYPPPSVVKIDVEGAEIDILHGARQTLHDLRPIILLSTHERLRPGVQGCCLQLLAANGYEVLPLGGTSGPLDDPQFLARPVNAT